MHNMEFLYCLECLYCGISASSRFGYGESVGDLQGDPILIPSLPLEAVLILPPDCIYLV